MYPARSSILLIQPLLRPLRPPNILSTPLKPRLFTHNSQLLLISPASPRPQLPFLHASSALRPLRSRNNVNIQYQLSRLLTTERKKYIKDQLWLASKWTAYGWAAIALALVMFFGVQEERIERKFPSPSEWTWRSRHTWRSAKGQEFAGMMEYGMTDWASVGVRYRKLIERLEDPSKDGADIAESLDGGILVAGVGKTGLDVSNKSEPWRRGYYEALMGSARVAEHLDGCLKDTTRNIVFPAEVVIGPSNPRPKPVPPGAHSAPLEENCTRAYATPESIYSKILTTTGFSTRQRLDAALAYADWLDYKDLPQSAEELYSWALDIAVSGLPPAAAASDVVDRKTGIINANADQAPFVTSNILLATTALATHHARTGFLSTALPILLSVLRARRSLPPAQASTLRFSIPDNDDETYIQPSLLSTISSLLRSLIVAPSYPPEPPSGNDAPKRDGKEICDEAGLMANVGEILFASGTEKREDGLAWTREAVDVAEATFTSPDTDLDGRKRCQECLDVGLGNWRKMVEKMVLAEKAERQQGLERKKKKSSGWFDGGASTGAGEQGEEEGEGRWMREERVVEERMKSVRGILLRQRIAGKGEGDGVLLFG